MALPQLSHFIEIQPHNSSARVCADLQSFVSLVFERMAASILPVLGLKVTPSLIKRMQVLHINEINLLTRAYTKELLNQWAGSQWPEGVLSHTFDFFCEMYLTLHYLKI